MQNFIRDQLTALNDDTRLIYLISGTLADDRPFYAYLIVKPGDYPALKKAEAVGPFRLSTFGTILLGETGTQAPPQDVRQLVREFFHQPDAMTASLFTASLEQIAAFLDRHPQ